jgi:cell division septation protein DedD
MTRMAPTGEPYEAEERSRSIFSNLWFRALVVVVVLGAVAVIAMPYVLDMVSPRHEAARPPEAPETPMPATTSEGAPPLPPAGAMGPSVETTRPSPAPGTEPLKPGAEVARVEPLPKPVPVKPAGRPAVTPTRAAAARGPYWVQVGAFRDAVAAKRLADRLRAEKFPVVESVKSGEAPASPGADRYYVFVSGSTPEEVAAKTGVKGMSPEAVAGGVVVKPGLPLREAVELSRSLAGEGLRVQVRRAGGAPSEAPGAAAASDGVTFHRVRVGSFPDRASAMTALKELQGKGYTAFLARGTQ